MKYYNKVSEREERFRNVTECLQAPKCDAIT